MNKNKKIIILIILILILVALLLAWQFNNKNNIELNDTSISEPENVKRPLLVGTAIAEPFVYFDENGQLSGYDIELMQAISENLGDEVEFIEMPFANLIPALENNNVDIIIAAIHITPERQNIVSFSKPYLNTGLVMVIDPNKTQMNRISQINNKNVGVKIGATGFDFAQKLLTEGYNFSLMEYKDTKSSFLDLGIGRVDVIFNDYINSIYLISETFNNLAIVRDKNDNVIFIDNVGLGIAVNKSNQQLLDKINTALEKNNIYKTIPFFNEK